MLGLEAEEQRRSAGEPSPRFVEPTADDLPDQLAFIIWRRERPILVSHSNSMQSAHVWRATPETGEPASCCRRLRPQTLVGRSLGTRNRSPCESTTYVYAPVAHGRRPSVASSDCPSRPSGPRRYRLFSEGRRTSILAFPKRRFDDDGRLRLPGIVGLPRALSAQTRPAATSRPETTSKAPNIQPASRNCALIVIHSGGVLSRTSRGR